MKPLLFHGAETKNESDVINDSYERLYKLGIVKKDDVEFVTFQLHEDAKK